MNIFANPAISWIAIAVLMTVAEAFSLGLTTIWFAIGALFAMVVALIGLSFWWQIITFVGSSAILLYYTRPIAVKHLKIGSKRTNIHSLIGEVGITTAEITSHKTGQVKIKGQIWTAVSSDKKTIDEGTEVIILEIEGVKLIVTPKKEA